MKTRNRHSVIFTTLLLISLMLGFFGCGYTKLSSEKTTVSRAAVWHPEPFEIIYSSGSNEINSKEGYIKKDLVVNGFAKSSFLLTNNDKNRIYAVIKNIDLTTFPDNSGYGGGSLAKSLWIKCGNIEKRISLGIYDNPKNKEEAVLKQLEDVLDDILFYNSNYQSMPKPEGYRL